MRAALALLAFALTQPARGQEPLRKTDLVRLLSGATLAPDELAVLIRRNCLSFTPTGRDRADLAALGADSGVLREIEGCARRAAAARVAVPKPAARPPAPAAAPVISSAAPSPPPAARRAPLSAPRTGFVLGTGQHAVVGTRPTRALVFEVRDTAGQPVPNQEVALAATNARLGATRAVTDSGGRVLIDLTLGARVGPAVVSATVGAMERQATLYGDPGPAVKLVFRCGDEIADRRVAFFPDVPVVLRVTAQDAFGNTVPVVNLQAAAGDRGVLRVAFVGGDTVAGLVRVQPRGEGSTSLVVVASRQREDLSATVAKTPPPGATHCPQSR